MRAVQRFGVGREEVGSFGDTRVSKCRWNCALRTAGTLGWSLDPDTLRWWPHIRVIVSMAPVSSRHSIAGIPGTVRWVDDARPDSIEFAGSPMIGSVRIAAASIMVVGAAGTVGFNRINSADGQVSVSGQPV